MNLSFQNGHIALERRGWIRLRNAAGVRIACRSGAVWITQHHDTRDIVLRAGETLEIDGCGVTVIQATEPARLALEERAPKLEGKKRWKCSESPRFQMA